MVSLTSMSSRLCLSGFFFYEDLAMTTATIIGIDLGKQTFHLHAQVR
ncbi:hypothetical protein [Halomonas sp. I5-271120]|nr:hypothetical protein [Halomonas sp. I5-271120]